MRVVSIMGPHDTASQGRRSHPVCRASFSYAFDGRVSHRCIVHEALASPLSLASPICRVYRRWFIVFVFCRVSMLGLRFRPCIECQNSEFDILSHEVCLRCLVCSALVIELVRCHQCDVVGAVVRKFPNMFQASSNNLACFRMSQLPHVAALSLQ